MQKEIYRVAVRHAEGPGVIDSTEVEVGQWQSIAYWLDERGYIDPAYAIEVRVAEVEA